MSLIKSIKRDIQAAFQHDPAAKSTIEVLFAYPGFHARQLHRLAHTLHKWHLPVPPNATVVGVPGRVVEIRNPDTIERLPDPVWEKLQALEKKVEEMERRLIALRGENESI